MFEAKCYDMYGNSIDGFTQWDVNQKMKIVLESCEDDDHIEDDYMRIAPEVHFSNIKRDKALVVRSTVKSKNSIVVDVPNVLLTEAYPVLIYVYYTSSKDSSSQTTIVRTELPVRKRSEPHDYYYVENIERITAEMIKEEIEADTEETRSKAIEEINAEKAIAVDAINEEERLAVEAINAEEESAKTVLQSYVDAGKQIKEDTAAIKSETQAIKDATDAVKTQVEVLKSDVEGIAATAAETIKEDIYDEIHRSGVQLQMTNVDNGICTISFVTIDQE